MGFEPTTLGCPTTYGLYQELSYKTNALARLSYGPNNRLGFEDDI